MASAIKIVAIAFYTVFCELLQVLAQPTKFKNLSFFYQAGLFKFVMSVGHQTHLRYIHQLLYQLVCSQCRFFSFLSYKEIIKLIIWLQEL